LLTVDFARFPVTQATGCSTWGAAQAATPSRCTGAAPTSSRSTSTRPELKDVAGMFAGHARGGRGPGRRHRPRPVRGSAYALPFEDGTFDRVVAAEVLEHLPQDERAMAELFRVLKPGGLIAVTVPRWGPELVCWALSSAYHEVEGGPRPHLPRRRAAPAASAAPA
jgi:SAM-dependent methyltransferase